MFAISRGLYVLGLQSAIETIGKLSDWQPHPYFTAPAGRGE
jgi:hypothetical protein